MLTFNDNQYAQFSDFKVGSEQAFSFFYRTYYNPLHRYGLKYIECPYIVEELLHDAFLLTWELKHLIECPRHLYCFIRLRLKWGCARYWKDRRRQRLICFEDIGTIFSDNSLEDRLFNDNKELLQLVYKALPLLPPTRKNIVTLYFGYGLSCKEIATKYKASNQFISRQLHDSIDFLKSLIKKKKKVSSISIISNKPAQLEQMDKGEVLKDEQLKLFRLRYEKKYSFDRIAYEMGMNVHEVQQKYVIAHRLLNNTKNKKNYSYG
jgi:RNA polymerase sigma factor (sigma-70 family)